MRDLEKLSPEEIVQLIESGEIPSKTFKNAAEYLKYVDDILCNDN